VDRHQEASIEIARPQNKTDLYLAWIGSLIYPIWSPDGRYIVADAYGGPRNGAWIYIVSTHKWKRLPLVEYNFWAWSHDSKYIYYDVASGDQPVAMRLRVADGKIEKVANLTGIRRAGSVWRVVRIEPRGCPPVTA
jgi:Tol biopolymer transport system component